MKALIVHESYFGNTKTIAESIYAFPIHGGSGFRCGF